MTHEVRELLQDHHASSPPGDPNDPDVFADTLSSHGLTLVSLEALTEMERATREATAGGVTHAHGQHGMHWHDAADYDGHQRPIDNEVTAGPPEPVALDVHAVVDLLGHTRRIGRLANCAEIPGFVRLTEVDGTVRLINPHKAVFEIEVVTEAEAQERARPAGAAWDSARGRLLPYEDDEDDPPFDDEGDDE